MVSGTGTKGNYYIVSTAGTTSIDGIAVWNAADVIIFNGTAWDKVDGITSEVTSVAGRTGNVALAASDISGLATSATTDTTNASNISSGTLNAGRLPSFSGDASVTAGTSVITLASVNADVGTYAGITVDAKGLVTAAVAETTLAGYGITDAQPLNLNLTDISNVSALSGNLTQSFTLDSHAVLAVTFEEDTIVDYLGNTYAASGTNDVLTTAKSLDSTTALQIYDDASFIEFPEKSAYDLRATSSTIECWLYLPTATQSGIRTIFGLGANFYAATETLDSEIYLITPDASYGGSALPVNQWFHLAITNNSTTNLSKIWVNGVEVTSYTSAVLFADYAYGNVVLGSVNGIYGSTSYMNNFAIYDYEKYTTTFTPNEALGTHSWQIDGNTYITGNQTITISGDASGSGTTSIALTLDTVNSNVGTFGSATAIPSITVNAKGLVTAITTDAVSIPSGTITLTGDVTTSGTTGSSTATTLATVNSNTGSFGSATQVAEFTVNAKGLVTAASNVTITPPFSAITGSLAATQLPAFTGDVTSSCWK